MKTLLLALMLAVAPVVAYAQTDAALTEAQPSPETLTLAREMHDIWPIRTRIEAAIDGIAAGFPPERQAEVKATMRKSIQFNAIEQASIKAMASTFTVEELKAMIAFYGSDVGRSISAKTGDYEAAIRPAIGGMIDKALMDLRVGQQP